jgi:periplasmic divalent cation tolerance protein
MSGFCMVTTTTRGDNVKAIIEAVLSQQLAACVQVTPIRSHYVWQGVLRDEVEDMLVIKAKLADYVELEAAIRAVHVYDVPEILRVDVAAGSAPYLDWIMEMTRAAPEKSAPPPS